MTAVVEPTDATSGKQTSVRSHRGSASGPLRRYSALKDAWCRSASVTGRACHIIAMASGGRDATRWVTCVTHGGMLTALVSRCPYWQPPQTHLSSSDPMEMVRGEVVLVQVHWQQ